MPFKRVNIGEVIEIKSKESAEFKDAMDSIRNHNALLQKVACIRDELNLTQTDLAYITHCSQQKISRMENRKHSPSLKTFCRIVNAMGYELVLQKKSS